MNTNFCVQEGTSKIALIGSSLLVSSDEPFKRPFNAIIDVAVIES